MTNVDDVFAVPVFFICFRECLECVIIVSILFALLKTSLGKGENYDRVTYRKLCKQVWWGVGIGFGLCLVIGAGMIGGFYAYHKDSFSPTEDIWEGTFSLIATIIISIMGAALLRVSKLQDKWRVKLAKALEEQKIRKHSSAGNRFKLWCEKYAMFLLPFITVLREGLEAVVFIGGVGLSLPASAFPLAVFCGLLAGIAVGYLIYRGGATSKLQIFLIISTCVLYLVAAGLFSKAVWAFEEHAWNVATGGDAAGSGSGPGSYNIHQSVWHVNCCNAEVNGGGWWGIFNSILGWENSATYGSVISYNVYWIAVMVIFWAMRYFEKHGHWPLMKRKAKYNDPDPSDQASPTSEEGNVFEEKDKVDGQVIRSDVREIRE